MIKPIPALVRETRDIINSPLSIPDRLREWGITNDLMTGVEIAEAMADAMMITHDNNYLLTHAVPTCQMTMRQGIISGKCKEYDIAPGAVIKAIGKMAKHLTTPTLL